jgi:hypothetical protein
MIFPIVALEEWIEHHPELEFLVSNCDWCQKTMIANSPFIEWGYAGLISKPCECGKNKNQCLIKLTTKSTYNFSKKSIKSY